MNKWDKRFLELADHISSWSKDNSTKVGCVIVRPDNTIASVGYNGFPRGVNDDESRYSDRNIKYMMVKHAEENAIFSSTESLTGFTAYVTHHPCSSCTGSLIQNGIKKIITKTPKSDFAVRFKESFEVSKIMLEEAGVELVLVDEL